jgi:hypothetical protein
MKIAIIIFVSLVVLIAVLWAWIIPPGTSDDSSIYDEIH